MGMDENEALYGQKLFYNQAVGPYQCLSLPWWIRTGKHKTYIPRHQCHIEPLVCGEDVFARIQADILAARRSVDIITWGFDPGMVLVRGATAEDGMRYGDLIKQIATRKENPVTVRLLLWHDNAASYAIQKNNPGLYGTRVPTIGAYAGYYNETHDRYNRAWFDEIIANELPNVVLRTREVALEYRKSALAGEKYEISPIDGMAGSIYPTHHQKMILVDYETPERAVGYVMGHNSTTDFWDTVTHRFRDIRREILYRKNPAEAISQLEAAMDEVADSYQQKLRLWSGQPEQPSTRRAERLRIFGEQHGFTAKPYQDVSLRVRGAILYDMNHNFCHGWEESVASTPDLGNAIWMTPAAVASAVMAVANKVTDQKLTQSVSLVHARQHLKAADFALKDCHHSAQLLRTYPATQEKSIKECYANLTRLTQHYIFIQNQYIQYEEWANYIVECAEKLRKAGYTKPIYVFIVTSTPETDGMDLATYDVALQLGSSETMTFEHKKSVERAIRGNGKVPITPVELEKRGIKALMASMWSGAEKPRSAKDYEETYIHAKVAIVDDAAFTVGSANLNVRSMALDSELNVLSQAMDVAFDLRKKLFKQCIDEDGPVQFGDMSAAFKKWQEVMQRNTGRMESGQPLKGQIARFHVDREPGPPVI